MVSDFDVEVCQGPPKISIELESDGPRVVRAMEEIKRMRGGAQSHLMRCSDGRNHELYYVVKFRDNPQGSRTLVNDLLGTRLARLLGLPTTLTAVVEVGEDLIRYTPGLNMELPRSRNPCCAGLQFGSMYPGDPRFLTLFDLFPRALLPGLKNLCDFAGMLVFDKWTCNTDSRQALFFRRDTAYEAVMIDQGFCFNATEWNFPDAPLRGRYQRLEVYNDVRSWDSFEPWLTRLESKIDLDLIVAAAQGIPRVWYEDDTGALSRLLERLDRRRKIVRELIWSMAEARPTPFPNWEDRTYRASA
jgi:hypothetical protein